MNVLPERIVIVNVLGFEATAQADHCGREDHPCKQREATARLTPDELRWFMYKTFSGYPKVGHTAGETRYRKAKLKR